MLLNEFLYEKKIDLLAQELINYPKEQINETKVSDRFYKHIKLLTNDVRLQTYFMTTFGAQITAMWRPLEELLSKKGFNGFTDEELTMLAVGILSEFIFDKDPEAMALIEEKTKHLLGAKKFLNKLKVIFGKVIKKVKRVVSNVANVASYGSLFIPFIKILSKLIGNESLVVDDIERLAVGAMVYASFYGTKSLLKK